MKATNSLEGFGIRMVFVVSISIRIYHAQSYNFFFIPTTLNRVFFTR